MTSPRELIGSAAGIFGLRIAAAGSAYVTQVILARWLGAAALGTYVFAASVLIVVGTLSALGLPTAGPRFLPRFSTRGDWHSVGRYLRFSRVVALGCGALAGAAGWLGYLLGLYTASKATLVALTGVPLFALLLVNSGYAHGLRRHHLSALASSARAVGLLLTVAAMSAWAAGGSAQQVMFAYILVIIAVLIAQTILVSRIVDLPRISFDSLRRRNNLIWVRSSSGLLVVSLCSSYLAELVVLATNTYSSAEELAVLNAVLRTAALLLFVMAAVDHVVVPEYSTSYSVGDQKQLRQVVQHATRIRLGAVVAGGAVLVIVGRSILGLFGPGFDVGYRPLAVALAGLVLRAAAGGAPQLILATSGTKPLVAASLSGLAVGLAMNFALVRVSPVMSGALAFALATAGTAWISRSICIRRLGFDPSIVGAFTGARTNSSWTTDQSAHS